MADQLDKIFITEDVIMIKIDKKIKECDNSSLFNFIYAHFFTFFLDLEELRNFISYLYNKKGEILVKEILDNFSTIIKEFKS